MIRLNTDINELNIGTDELTVEFFACPSCGFEHIPKLQETDFAKEFGDAVTTTARFCPGCGEGILWIQDETQDIGFNP